MSGIPPFNLPIATLYSSNLTPDLETGIRRYVGRGAVPDAAAYYNLLIKGKHCPS